MMTFYRNKNFPGLCLVVYVGVFFVALLVVLGLLTPEIEKDISLGIPRGFSLVTSSIYGKSLVKPHPRESDDIVFNHALISKEFGKEEEERTKNETNSRKSTEG